MSLSIRELQREVAARSQESFHDIDDWAPTDYACCLGEELGEVLGVIKRIRRLKDGLDKSYNQGVTIEGLTVDLGKELADIVKYTCLLASRMNLDLEDSVIQKFNEVSDRVHSPRKL